MLGRYQKYTPNRATSPSWRLPCYRYGMICHMSLLIRQSCHFKRDFVVSIVCCCSWWTFWTLSLNTERAADIRHWNVWTADEKVVQSLIPYYWIFRTRLHVHLKKWTLKFKLLYLLNHICYLKTITGYEAWILISQVNAVNIIHNFPSGLFLACPVHKSWSHQYLTSILNGCFGCNSQPDWCDNNVCLRAMLWYVTSNKSLVQAYTIAASEFGCVPDRWYYHTCRYHTLIRQCLQDRRRSRWRMILHYDRWLVRTGRQSSQRRRIQEDSGIAQRRNTCRR